MTYSDVLRYIAKAVLLLQVFVGVCVLSWAFAALIYHSLHAVPRVQRMMNKCSERERIINKCSERERIMNKCSERERMMNKCSERERMMNECLFLLLIRRL